MRDDQEPCRGISPRTMPRTRSTGELPASLRLSAHLSLRTGGQPRALPPAPLHPSGGGPQKLSRGRKNGAEGPGGGGEPRRGRAGAGRPPPARPPPPPPRPRRSAPPPL